MADKKSFHFTDLHLKWGPAKQQNVLDFEEFSDQINILKGPNASGKTTTARALRQLLWKNAPRYIQNSVIQATARTESNSWRFQWNYGSDKITRSGTDVNRSTLTGGTESDRYHLSLHELLVEDDQALAQQLYQEMLGGYDLQKAYEQQEYSGSIKTKKINEHGKLKNAVEKEENLRQNLKKLKQDEQKLDDLREQLEKITHQKQRLDLLNKLLSFSEFRDQKKQLEIQLQNFDQEVAFDALSGDEWQDLNDLEDKRRACKQKINGINTKIDERRQERQKLQLPDEKPSPKQVRKWQERLNALKKRLQKIEGKRSESRQEIRELKTLKYGLTGSEKNIDWQEPSRDAWNKLEDLVKQLLGLKSESKQLQEQKKAIASRIDKLTDLPDKNELDRLFQALKEISPDGDDNQEGRISLQVALISVLIAGVAGLAGVFIHWGIALAGLLAAIGIVVWMARKAESETPADDQWLQIIQRSNIVNLEGWETGEISEALDSVVAKKQELERKESLKNELGEIEVRINSRQEDIDQKEKELDALIKEFGNLPEFSDYSALFRFVKQWSSIHKRVAKLHGLLENISTLTRKVVYDRKELLDEISYLLPGDAEFENLSGLEEWLNNLLDRIEKDKEIDNERKRLQDNLGHTQSELENIEQDISEIRQYFPDDAEMQQIRTWCKKAEQYKQLKDDLREQESKISYKTEEIKNHELFEEDDLDLTEGAITHEKDQIEQQVAREEDLRSQAEEIDKELHAVRRNRDLEEAHLQTQQAWHALKERRDENLHSLVGHTLYQQLREQTHINQTPDLLKKAEQWFSIFTNGAYSLQIQTGAESGQPQFQAYEEESDSYFSLDQLSGGSRIQLLLAVRLAYVEHHEGDIKLPLLIDELLANSDDQRARQIINALIEIARDGRQIFYFTAQSDEVSKWRAVSSNDQVDIKEFSLAGQTDGKEFNQKPLGEDLNIVIDIPAPEDVDHAEYARLLEPPVFNPVTDAAGSLHLWYLIDQTDLLYNLLDRGISTWSQLSKMAATDSPLPLDDDRLSKIEQTMDALKKYLALRKKGHPQPINEAVLQDVNEKVAGDSEVITSSFWDKVVAKMREVDYNPERLIQALYDGEVSRFREENKEQLRNYFLEQGYLSHANPLSPKVIQDTLNNDVAKKPDFDRRYLQTVIQRIEDRLDNRI